MTWLLTFIQTRQNNALLNSLSSKVSALRSVTIDIHDNARDQDTLDHTVCLTWPQVSNQRELG